MKLSIAKDDGQDVHVAVLGQVTQRDIDPIAEPLQDLLGPAAYTRQVHLDLSETSYLDSSGIGWLLKCHKRMRERGGKLTLHAPHPVVANTLRVLKLDKVFHVAASGDQAKGGLV